MIHPDQELLQNFVTNRCERSFAELVNRYVNLVYSAARRQCDDAQGAEEITQLVFIKLAQKAHTIRKHEAISGWLLVTTRYVALNERRAIHRRQHHEREAAVMRSEIASSEAGNPLLESTISSVLDDAMSRLRTVDRDALALRFFEERSLGEVGARLGVSEQAARKRVDRAIAKLRDILRRKGVGTSSEALTSVLLTAAVAPAPANLVAQIVPSAMAAAQAPVASVGIAKGAMILMTMSKAKLAAVVTIVAVAGLTPVAYVAMRPEAPEVSAPTISAQTGWKEDFQKIYALAPGEMARHVAPPFISVRDAFIAEYQLDKPEMGGYPTSLLIRDNGTTLRWQQATSMTRDVGDVLMGIARIWPQDTDLPRDLLAKKVEGDWVLHKDATVEQIAPVVSQSISQLLKRNVTLRQEPMEREVLVVTGTFEFKPLNPQAPQFQIPTIQFILDSSDQRAGSIAQSEDDLMQLIGEALGRPVVNEAHFATKSPYMITYFQGADFRRTPQIPTGDVLSRLLVSLQDQTGLSIRIETRTVPTWRMR